MSPKTISQPVHLRRDRLYDIGGKVMSLDEIQQAVIDSAMYQEQLRILMGESK